MPEHKEDKSGQEATTHADPSIKQISLISWASILDVCTFFWDLLLSLAFECMPVHWSYQKKRKGATEKMICQKAEKSIQTKSNEQRRTSKQRRGFPHLVLTSGKTLSSDFVAQDSVENSQENHIFDRVRCEVFQFSNWNWWKRSRDGQHKFLHAPKRWGTKKTARKEIRSYQFLTKWHRAQQPL